MTNAVTNSAFVERVLQSTDGNFHIVIGAGGYKLIAQGLSREDHAGVRSQRSYNPAISHVTSGCRSPAIKPRGDGLLLLEVWWQQELQRPAVALRPPHLPSIE